MHPIAQRVGVGEDQARLVDRGPAAQLRADDFGIRQQLDGDLLPAAGELRVRRATAPQDGQAAVRRQARGHGGPDAVELDAVFRDSVLQQLVDARAVADPRVQGHELRLEAALPAEIVEARLERLQAVAGHVIGIERVGAAVEGEAGRAGVRPFDPEVPGRVGLGLVHLGRQVMGRQDGWAVVAPEVEEAAVEDQQGAAGRAYPAEAFRRMERRLRHRAHLLAA